MTPQEFDFTIVARAGLTQQEFAKLTGVSRVTANMWVRGKMKPHRYLKTKAARVVSTLEKAIVNATLPIPKEVKSIDREAAIKQAFVQAYAAQ
jgi:DNA-binding XRE family transcriptional regulator